MDTKEAVVAPIGADRPVVTTRRPYSTPLLTRFGLVRDWTQKSGLNSDNSNFKKT